MEPHLWPIWEANVAFTVEASNEAEAKLMVQNAERQLDQTYGLHVLGATVLKRKDEPTDDHHRESS